MKVSLIFLDSSAVEHSAVNRRVVGSNPTRGVDRQKLLVSSASDEKRLAKKGDLCYTQKVTDIT